MSVSFTLHTTPTPLAGKPSVPSVPGVLSGFYDETARDILVPDRNAVRAALPARWRRALDRSGAPWFDRNARILADGQVIGGAAHMTLCGSRGRPLATLYFFPVRNA